MLNLNIYKALHISKIIIHIIPKLRNYFKI